MRVGATRVVSKHPGFDKLTAIANAEAFHKNPKAAKEPSDVGQKYLANAYPGVYPQWAHLVVPKAESSPAATKGH